MSAAIQIKKSSTYLPCRKNSGECTLIRDHKLKRSLKLRQQASLIYNKWWSSLQDRFRDGGVKEKKELSGPERVQNMIGIHNTTWPLSSYISLCLSCTFYIRLSHIIKVDHMWSVPLSLTLISYSRLYGVSLRNISG